MQTSKEKRCCAALSRHFKVVIMHLEALAFVGKDFTILLHSRVVVICSQGSCFKRLTFGMEACTTLCNSLSTNYNSSTKSDFNKGVEKPCLYKYSPTDKR